MEHMTELPRLAEADGVFFLTLAKGDRTSIATTIQRLIDMLDAMEPDPDLEDGNDDEPSIGWPMGHGLSQLDPSVRHDDDREGDGADYEATLGWGNGSQARLHADNRDEAEDENERGGDICDEPHDHTDSGDDEPTLGWGDQWGQGPKIGSGLKHDPAVQCLESNIDACDSGGLYLSWDGDGNLAARTVLRNLKEKRPDVQQNRIGGWCDGDYQALRVEGLTIKSNKGREKVGAGELTLIRPGVAMVGGWRP